MSKKLPAVIPLIKLRDNGSNPPETFYFGDDTHDCLLIQDNAIIYHNYQNGEATFPIDPNEPNDSYEFVGEDDGYYLKVEMFDLEEYVRGFKSEIAALKAENERLRGEKSILERGIDIELKASRRSDHHMQQKIWLVNELLSQIQPEQLTTVSKIKDILGSGTRENRSRPDLYADILEQKEMLLCEAAEAEAQAECERRNKEV